MKKEPHNYLIPFLLWVIFPALCVKISRGGLLINDGFRLNIIIILAIAIFGFVIFGSRSRRVQIIAWITIIPSILFYTLGSAVNVYLPEAKSEFEFKTCAICGYHGIELIEGNSYCHECHSSFGEGELLLEHLVAMQLAVFSPCDCDLAKPLSMYSYVGPNGYPKDPSWSASISYPGLADYCSEQRKQLELLVDENKGYSFLEVAEDELSGR